MSLTPVSIERSVLLDELQQKMDLAQREGTTVVLALVDVRNFHRINKLYGFAGGDAVLGHVFAGLRKMPGRSPVVRRVGNDEFAVLFSGIASASMLPIIGSKVVRALDDGLLVAEREVNFDVNVGLAAYPRCADNRQTLYFRAEEALRQARERGLPYLVDDPDTRPPESRDWQLELKLLDALSHNELELWYQPKLDLRTGKVVAPEALLRWDNKGGEPLPPPHFISIIEQSGRGHDLARWVLNTALRQCREWGELGVAVNLSAAAMGYDDMAGMIASALRIWGVAPERLTVEINQSGLIRDTEACALRMQSLCDAGVRVSIDDFGTGHSSLAQFRALPAHELKIDRDFVARAVEDEGDRAICEHIVSLAHRFGKTIVAEGVEDQQTLDLLRAMGCDIVQGYRVARPMLAGQLSEWLRGFDAGEFAPSP